MTHGTRCDETICERPKDIWVSNVICDKEQLLHDQGGHDSYYSWNKMFSIPWKPKISLIEEERVFVDRRKF